MKFYDKEHNRLIFFHEKANKDYWDEHWDRYFKKKESLLYKLNPKMYFIQITKKFLKPEDGPILEGGCGLGYYVYNLSALDYDCIGIDNAKDTIKLVNKKLPHLKVQYGDIRQIPFPNNYFAGYWSMGVIEHFFEGFDEIIKEMNRVIKPKGYLFLTFPHMSPFRNFKTKANLYRIFNNAFYKRNDKPKTFYQYALDKSVVIKDLNNAGFNLIYLEQYSGLKGFKDEIFILKFFLKNLFQLIYNNDRNKLILIIKGFLNKILSRYASHTILLVFQKV